MRIYNPQNQYGEDLITKNLVKTITGLEGLKDGKNINQRLVSLEGSAPSSALHEIIGDESDAFAKITFTKDGSGQKATATLTTTKATVNDGVISGAGIASGTQVATAIEKEATRATGVEGDLANLTTDAKSNLVAAINEVDGHATTAQSEVDALETKVGVIPSGSSAPTVVDYATEVAGKRLQSILGNAGGGVSVVFTTDDNKAVTTTVTVTESTLVADDKFASTDTNVTTGAKVQQAIDAAEARAIS